MYDIQQVKNEIEALKQRNQRVDKDKAWETSWTRKISVALLTYIVIVIFFLTADFQKPFTNAIVPTIGFLLSTLSVGSIKKLWVKKVK